MNTFTLQEQLKRTVSNYLYRNRSASTYELKKLGIRCPASVIKWLRQDGMRIDTKYQKTYDAQTGIVYGHYRYVLRGNYLQVDKKNMPIQQEDSPNRHIKSNTSDNTISDLHSNLDCDKLSREVM